MKFSWPLLITGLIVTTVGALGVHAIMLDGLHVPYPYKYPHSGWPIFPDAFVFTLAALYLVSLLDYRFQKLSIAGRCCMFFLVLATIKESLFRAAFMDIMNSRSIVYPIAQATPKLLTLAITAILTVLSAKHTKRQWTKWFGALAISALVFFLFAPLIDFFSSRLLTSIAWMSGPSLYDPPYDYHILVPAYLSFLEPVFTSFFIAALVWNNLPTSTMLRIGMFTLLILGLKGPVTKPFINIHFANTDPITAVLSLGQFSFEAIALGCLTAVTWTIVNKRRLR